MVQKVKKPKKKAASKSSVSAKTTNSENPEQQPQQEQSSSSIRHNELDSQENWTPMQREQIELSKKLDNYIGEFQKKVLRLNFQPSSRELIILFIMNLHPRWRRMVESVELSCSSWVEAAAFARLHCARVSAILGCENRSDAIFKTPEARALRDSGYFAPDDSDLKPNSPASISHLLLHPEEENDFDKSDTESSLPPVSTAITSSSSSSSSSSPSSIAAAATTSSTATATVVSLSARTPTAADQKQSSNAPKKVTESEIRVKPTTSKEKGKTSPSVSPSVSHSIASEATQTQKPDVKDAVASSTLSQASSPSLSSAPALPTKVQMQAKVQQAIKNRKEKEKEKRAQTQLQQQRKQWDKMVATITPDQMDTLLTHVPKQHLGVNLSFLELSVNGKKVKGLLAKLSWGSSAISLDCANRLGLHMKPSDLLCINTDFGYVDSIGILTLPIHHPADPAQTISEMDIQVLPMIYGGKVDLVLGADFFCFYNPTLNIRTRAIRFLEKETPYIVEKLVE